MSGITEEYLVGQHGVALLDTGEVIVTLRSGPNGPELMPTVPAQAAQQLGITNSTALDAKRLKLMDGYKVPTEGDTVLQYTFRGQRIAAEVELIDRDVLLVKNGAPWMGDLVELAQRLDVWKPPTVTNAARGVHTNLEHRSSMLSRIDKSTHPEFQSWCESLRRIEGLWALAYQALVNCHLTVTQGSGYDLLTYGLGDRFGEHIDKIQHDPHHSRRALTITPFWSSEDIEGGILRLPRQDLDIHPNPGDVVLMLSNEAFPHESTPVTKGSKQTLVGWLV